MFEKFYSIRLHNIDVRNHRRIYQIIRRIYPGDRGFCKYNFLKEMFSENLGSYNYFFAPSHSVCGYAERDGKITPVFITYNPKNFSLCILFIDKNCRTKFDGWIILSVKDYTLTLTDYQKEATCCEQFFSEKFHIFFEKNCLLGKEIDLHVPRIMIPERKKNIPFILQNNASESFSFFMFNAYKWKIEQNKLENIPERKFNKLVELYADSTY